MLQMESSVVVADNTGAKTAKMIGVIGKRTRFAHVGDVITAHIRDSIPTASVKKDPSSKPWWFAPVLRSVVPMVRFCASTRMRLSSSTKTTTHVAPVFSDLWLVNFAKNHS